MDTLVDWIGLHKDEVTALAGAAAALAGLAVAAFTFFLWRSTTKLWEATNENVKAVKENARWFKRAEMAHIIVIHVALESNLQRGTSVVPKFQVHMKNAGRLPAYVHDLELQFGVGSDIEKLGSRPDTVKKYGFFIAPEELLSPKDGFGTREISSAEIDAVLDSTLPFFVWGVVRFDNGLGDTWKSGFAFELRNPAGPLPTRKAVHTGGPKYWIYEEERTGS